MILRTLDFIFATLGLIVLSPILITTIVLLRFTGEAEIFYKQVRIGRGGKPFNLLKFATMLKDSPNLGAGDITLNNDPRVLPLGKVLRKTKVNELPQLINVFMGEMSLVGPRPMVPKSFQKYGESGKIISQVVPGLTGVGSVIFRDEQSLLPDKNPLEFYFSIIHPYKAELELWYVENRSFFLYLKILLITFFCVLNPNFRAARYFKDTPIVPNELVDKI